MSFLSNFFGVGQAVDGVKTVGGIIDNLFTSDEERLSKKETMQRLMMEPQKAQTEINKIEAAHRSLFVAGWRPFIGWVCGWILFYTFFLRDLLMWGLMIFAPHIPPLPQPSLEVILELIFALLGLGAMRTYEKVKRISK